MKKKLLVLLSLLSAMTVLTFSAAGCGEKGNNSQSSGSESTSTDVGSSSSSENSDSSSSSSSENFDSSSSSGSEDSDSSSSAPVSEEYEVAFNDVEGVTFSGEAKVVEGNAYTFQVAVNTGYQKAEGFLVSATMGGEAVTLTQEGDNYVVEKVTGALVISVEGVEKKSFNIIKPTATGVVFEGEETVTFGEDYTFKINFADGYRGNADFSVSVNGKTVTADANGVYTVEEVKSAVVIIVEGVEEVQYFATFTSDYADALINQQEGFKYEAENYTFKIELNDKYSQCAEAISVFYKIEGGEEEIEISPDADGVYTIANPQANLQIIVKNVSINRYLVSFMRNAVKMYELWGTAGEALTQAQLDEALAVLVGENEEFVAWREDISVAIEEDMIFSVVTKAKEAWGTLIEGNPLKDGAEQTGEYSAAGYEKVYVKQNFEKGPFADVDLSDYETVKFAFKHTNSWILFGNWEYYMDCRATWIDVTMVKNTQDGEWQVTMEAPVNHNKEGGAEVLNPYTTTLTGSTLNEIFANWYNDSNATTLYVTEVYGVKPALYGTEIVAQAIAGSTETAEVDKPYGFEKTYKYASIPVATEFEAVDISGYSEIKFNMWLDNGYICIVGWGAFAENAHWGKQWVPITLTNNGNNWTVSIEARISNSSGVSDAYPYTYTASGSKLNEVLATWFDFASDNATIYITELRGTEKEPEKPWGTMIDECVVTVGATLDTSASAAAGFEYAYVLGKNTQFNNSIKSETDLSAYSEVRFAVKATKYFLINGWAVYFKESYTDWAEVVMVNNGDGTWTVSVYADVYTASTNTVDNPYVITCTGTSIKTILSKWESDSSSIYVTELRGTLKA